MNIKFSIKSSFLILNVFIFLNTQLFFESAQGAAAPAAGTAAGLLAGAQAASASLGSALMSICAPPNVLPCILAALSFLQSKEHGKAKRAAATTRADFQSSGGYDDSNAGYDDFSSPDSPFAPFKSDLEKLGIKDEAGLYRFNNDQLALLEKKGIKINDKDGTISAPGGKTFPLSAFASAKSMQDAGMPIGEINAIEKIAKTVTDKYKVSSVGLAGGGGGGGGSASYGNSNSDSYKDPYDLLGLREKPQAARTAGLSRTLASGESIGTQTDSIFEMVSRRYQKKNDENIFVGP